MADALFEEEGGATPLTHEERLWLIPSYITLRGELNEVEQINITEGERRAYSRARDVLGETFLQDLHRRMFGQVWRWASDYSRERNQRLGAERFSCGRVSLVSASATRRAYMFRATRSAPTARSSL